jgi:GT2 family glycosyltransferase
MESAKTLVINIVTWNAARYLPKLFESLDRQTSNDFTVSVVDNASTDGTLAWLGENRPDVAILRNFRNQGFSRAHNQAIALAVSRWESADLDHRYVMVANADLEFAPDAVATVISYMDAHPEAAACCPKILRVFTSAESDVEHRETNRSTTIDVAGIQITRARRALDRGAGEEDKGQYDAPMEVFGCSGACAVFRASALQAAKLADEFFDEDIFAYQEDVDLAWRMRRLGLQTFCVPDAVIWHHRAAPSAPGAGWLASWRSRRKKSPFVNFYSTRNHGWVIIKNDEGVNLLIHCIWWFPYELAKLLVSIFSWAQLKGQFASLTGLPAMLHKRSELKRRAKVKGVEMRKWFK